MYKPLYERGGTILMKKLSLITVIIFILSLVQNIFYPASARAAEGYEPTAKGIIPTSIEGNDPNKGLPWIKINPDGSYETPDKYSSTITIVDVDHKNGTNLYNVEFSNGVTTELTCDYDSEKKEVAWSSTIPLMYVFVKASSGGLLYDYSTHQEILDDSKLLTPYTQNGPRAALSHVNFYFDPKPLAQKFGSLKVKKVYDGGTEYPTAYFKLKDQDGKVQEFSLENGKEVIIEKLALNKEYTLYETSPSGYEVSINDGKKVVDLTDKGYSFTLTEPIELSLVVTNKYVPEEEYGSLKVKKIFEGNKTYPTAKFTLKDQDGNVEKFSLENGKEVTIEKLALNKEYVLYEEPMDGYEAFIIVSSSEEPKLASEEIKLTEKGYAFKLTEPVQLYLVVKNKEIPPQVEYGSLKVKKVFEGDATHPTAYFMLKDKAGNIVREFSLLNNEEKTIEGLELNKEYVLYEKAITGYEATIIDAGKEVKLTDAGYTFILRKTQNTCAEVQLFLVVKNKLIPPQIKYGSLKVKKVYEGEGTHPAAKFILKDKSGNVVKEFTLLNNEETIINELSLNKEYVLYEESLEGYEALIIDSLSNEVKLTSTGYTFTLTEPVQLSLVVKNKKIVTPPEDKPVINPVLPKTGSMLGGEVLPLLGIFFILTGLVVFKGSKSTN